jgi:hypothetical protein
MQLYQTLVEDDIQLEKPVISIDDFVEELRSLLKNDRG